MLHLQGDDCEPLDRDSAQLQGEAELSIDDEDFDWEGKSFDSDDNGDDTTGEPSLSPSRKLDASLHDLSVPLHFRTTIVKFSHASIRSFLLKDRVAGQARTSKIKVGFGANNAELHITQVCLSLLSDRHSQQNFEVSSLSSYAARNFGSHLHSLERSSCPKKAKAHSPALLLISQLESYFELVG